MSFRGAGGAGAKDGFLFAIELIPAVILALGIVNVISLIDALRVVTSNVAQNLKLLPQKGTITQGSDADLLVLDERLQLQNVWARGNHMVADGKAIVFGTFEQR